jgi:Ca-activated chloride channel family protein
MFADKVYLLLLLLIPVLAVFFYVVLKKRETALDLLISRMNISTLVSVNLKAYKIKYILLLTGGGGCYSCNGSSTVWRQNENGN